MRTTFDAFVFASHRTQSALIISVTYTDTHLICVAVIDLRLYPSISLRDDVTIKVRRDTRFLGLPNYLLGQEEAISLLRRYLGYQVDRIHTRFSQSMSDSFNFSLPFC